MHLVAALWHRAEFCRVDFGRASWGVNALNDGTHALTRMPLPGSLVRAGIRFTDPSHNIYDIAEKDVPGESWWTNAKGARTNLRGKWDYKYESTAAFGGTIFWKYSAAFLVASGNTEYD